MDILEKGKPKVLTVSWEQRQDEHITNTTFKTRNKWTTLNLSKKLGVDSGGLEEWQYGMTPAMLSLSNTVWRRDIKGIGLLSFEKWFYFTNQIMMTSIKL